MPKARGIKNYSAMPLGLNSDASPTEFPEGGYSAEQVNFEYNPETRINRRRNAFYLESNLVDIPRVADTGGGYYLWRNEGSTPRAIIWFASDDEHLNIWMSNNSYMDGVVNKIQIYNHPSPYNAQLQFAEIGGKLLVTTGGAQPILITPGDPPTAEFIGVCIRDLTLFDADTLSLTDRPATLSNAHHYNLANAGWDKTRRCLPLRSSTTTDMSVSKPWYYYQSASALGNLYPSNADVVTTGKGATTDGKEEGFIPSLINEVENGSTPAPRGYYIYETKALDRIISNPANATHWPSLMPNTTMYHEQEMWETYPGGIMNAQQELDNRVLTDAQLLGTSDIYATPIQGICAFGQRAYYGGGQYVYYSKVINDERDYGRCYQEADPTADLVFDAVATDGGYIHLADVVAIQAMIPFRNGIVVFATNGVWMLSSGTTYFDPREATITKITDRAMMNPGASVLASTTIYYVSHKALMKIEANQYGELAALPIGDDVFSKYWTGTLIPENNPSVGGQRYWINWRDGTNELFIGTQNKNYAVYNITTGGIYPMELASSNIEMINIHQTLNEAAAFFVNDGGVTHYRFAGNGRTESGNADFNEYDTLITNAYLLSGPENLGKPTNKKGVTTCTTMFKRTEGPNNTSEPDAVYSVGSVSFIGNTSTYGMHTTTPYNAYKTNRRGYLSYTDGMFDPREQGDDIVYYRAKVRLGDCELIQFKLDTLLGYDIQLYGYGIEYHMRGRQ